MNPLWGDMPRYLGHRDASWNAMSFDFDKDLALTLKNTSFICRPIPISRSQVATTLGGGRQEDWMPLFLLPGVGHCGGGVAPDQADFLTAMERWRDGGARRPRSSRHATPEGAA